MFNSGRGIYHQKSSSDESYSELFASTVSVSIFDELYPRHSRFDTFYEILALIKSQDQMKFRDPTTVSPGPVCPRTGPNRLVLDQLVLVRESLMRFLTVAILAVILTKCELSRDEFSVCHALHRCHELWNRTGFNPVKLPAFPLRLSIFVKGMKCTRYVFQVYCRSKY